MSAWMHRLALPVFVLALFVLWQDAGEGQQDTSKRKGELQLAKPGTRFEFEVIESFDAKYLGDTPGHTGQTGGLGSTRPRIALGDPIYRGKEVVGKVTSVAWSHFRGSLTIEFDPEPLVRVAVGDLVAVDLNPAPNSKPAE